MAGNTFNADEINTPGINMTSEREQINYQPQIEYKPEDIHSPLIESSFSPSAPPESLKQPSMAALWGRAIDIVNHLQSLDTKLSTKLMDECIHIHEHQQEEILKAAARLGANDMEMKHAQGKNEEGHPCVHFGLYRKALQAEDSPDKQLIIDIFEGYQADVTGSLNAEIYPHIVEMQQDWEDTLEFIKKGIFAQVVPATKLPQQLKKDDPSIGEIDTAEKSLVDHYNAARLFDSTAEATLRPGWLYGDTSDAHRYLEAEYTANKRTLRDLERRMNTKAEAMSPIDLKMNQAESIVQTLTDCIDFKPYKGDTYEVLYNFIKQYNTRQEMENGLRKVQALIKLSVDKKTDDVNNMKANLRGLSSRVVKKSVGQSLVNGVHLRNEVFGNVLDTMNLFDGIPDNAAFHVAASHIVDGIGHSNQLYADQSSDFMRLHQMDAELRTEHISSLVDKDAARDIYKLLAQVLDYATKKNTWPTPTTLSSWLTAFMQEAQLS